MENPATWGRAERVVNDVIYNHERNRLDRPGVIGLSLTRQITDALRSEGLLMPDAEEDVAPVNALADLIDHWWHAADQPTVHHDGVEYVASLPLARFLLANGCRVNPPSTGDTDG